MLSLIADVSDQAIFVVNNAVEFLLHSKMILFKSYFWHNGMVNASGLLGGLLQ